MKKAKVTIVDENDNVIGEKERGTLDPEDIYRISALWLTNSKGEILIAKRADNKSHSPGKWGVAVAGTVEDGESYDENMVKEAEEEIGLRDIEFTKGPKGRSTKTYNFFYQWYFATVDMAIDGFDIDKNEVSDIRWISRDQLLKELKENPADFLIDMEEWVEDFS